MLTNKDLSLNTCMTNAKKIMDSFNALKHVAESDLIHALKTSGRIDLTNSVSVRFQDGKVMNVTYIKMNYGKVCLYGTNILNRVFSDKLSNITDIESFLDLCTELGI